MSGEIPASTLDAKPVTGWRRWLWGGENALLVIALALLTILPLLEILLRKFHTGISGSSAFVQHLTLIVGMVGGAIAARENRLLSFTSVSSFLKGLAQSGARVLSSSVAAASARFSASPAFGSWRVKRLPANNSPMTSPSGWSNWSCRPASA
jgi:TRAP-type C4-dicarboxylate transport system permease small subunit